jgi:hypothetical protein
MDKVVHENEPSSSGCQFLSSMPSEEEVVEMDKIDKNLRVNKNSRMMVPVQKYQGPFPQYNENRVHQFNDF